jgi:L-2,4-diaminobutyric acid acetyltransferase
MLVKLRDITVDLRQPRPDDGAAVWELVRETGVLDLNSPYAYFLLGEHFAETCVVAEREGEIGGFVSAYIPPQTPDSVFVWQVGVASSMRKQGLALQMLLALLRREACRDVRSLTTTITPSNEASRALFAGLANKVGAQLQEQPGHFPADWFPVEGHEAESLFTISPILHDRTV